MFPSVFSKSEKTIERSCPQRFIAFGPVAVLFLISSLNPVYGGDGGSSFSVEFTDCVESIGVTLLPTEQVEELIPEGFVVVGTGQPVTPIVVRTARCRISLDSRPAETGSVVQVGAVIVPPDFTGDINNYRSESVV